MSRDSSPECEILTPTPVPPSTHKYTMSLTTQNQTTRRIRYPARTVLYTRRRCLIGHQSAEPQEHLPSPRSELKGRVHLACAALTFRDLFQQRLEFHQTPDTGMESGPEGLLYRTRHLRDMITPLRVPPCITLIVGIIDIRPTATREPHFSACVGSPSQTLTMRGRLFVEPRP